MDLVRTLGVVIDPSGAKTGAAEASRAFEGIGKSARESESAAKSASKALRDIASDVRKTASASEAMREAMAKQTAILSKIDDSVRKLTGALKQQQSGAEQVTAANRRMAESHDAAASSATKLSSRKKAAAVSMAEYSASAAGAVKSTWLIVTSSNAAAASATRMTATNVASSASFLTLAASAAATSARYWEVNAAATAAQKSIRRLNSQVSLSSAGRGLRAQDVALPDAGSNGNGGSGRPMVNVTGSAPREMLLLTNGAKQSASAIERLNAACWSANTTMTTMSRSVATFVSGLFSMKTAIAAAGIGLFARDVMQTEMQLQRASNALRFASGDSATFAKNQQFVRQVSNSLGLDLLSTSAAFAKLSASAKGTSLEGADTRNLFLATAKAAAALGLSTDDTAGALNAFQQMLSKGNVQAEELRGQLGERLYGAFNMAARSMGVTTQELNKLLDVGAVTAAELLPKLAAEMDKTFGPDAAKNAHRLQAEMNRLTTAWTDFKHALFEGEAGEVLVSALSRARDILNDLTPRMNTLVGFVRDLAGITLPGMNVGREASFGYYEKGNFFTGGEYVSAEAARGKTYARMNARGIMAPAAVGKPSTISAIPEQEAPSADLAAQLASLQAAENARARGLDLVTMAQAQYADQIAETARRISAVKDIGLSIDAAKPFVFDKAKIDETSRSFGGLQAAAKTTAAVNELLALTFADIDEASAENFAHIQRVQDQLDDFFGDIDERSRTMTTQRRGRRGGPKEMSAGSTFADIKEGAQSAADEITDMFTQARNTGREAVGAMHDGISNFFADTIMGTMSVSQAFKKMTTSILTDIAKIVSQRMIAAPIAGAIATGLSALAGGFFGGAGGVGASAGTGADPMAGFGDGLSINPNVGYAHTGGVIGQTALRHKMVDPSIFANAPRFHSGLKPDEFPAILQTGETVVPRGKSAEPISISMPITVQVDGSKGGSPEEHQRFGAEIARQIQGSMDERIGQACRHGGVIYKMIHG